MPWLPLWLAQHEGPCVSLKMCKVYGLFPMRKP